MWMALTTVAGAFLAGFVANSIIKTRNARIDVALEKAESKVNDCAFRACKCERICATAAAADIQNGVLQDIELRCHFDLESALRRRRKVQAMKNKLCSIKVAILTWSFVVGGIAVYAAGLLCSLAKSHLERGEGSLVQVSVA